MSIEEQLASVPSAPVGTPTVLITGGRGRLAGAVAPAFVSRGWRVVALGHEQLDVTVESEVQRVVHQLRPTAVVNLAAWTDVDGCEMDPVRAALVNDASVGHVASACSRVGAHLCHVSSDYVFDGLADRPYRELDEPDPLSVYGRTKLDGERRVGRDGTVVRVGWLFGPHGRSLVGEIVRQARIPDVELDFVVDQMGSPTSTACVAEAIVHLTVHRSAGCFHVANAGSTSCFDLARMVVRTIGGDVDRVRPVTSDHLARRRVALRPAYSALDSSLAIAAGIPRPERWESAVQRFLRATAPARRAGAAGSRPLVTGRIS